MASLSNINGIFDVHSTGAILFSTSHGTSGQILKSNGNAAPTWIPQSDIVGDYLPLSGGTLTGATATASGISFTVGGALTGTTATFSGTVTFNDHTYHPDQVKSIFGTGSDAEIQFNGSHLFIDNTVGTTYLRNTGTGGSGFIFRNSNIGDFEFDNEFAGNIKFNTSNIERMRIDSSGKVGINTTVFPSSGFAKLVVAGGAIAARPSGVNDYFSYIKSNWALENAFEIGIEGAGTQHRFITSGNYYHGTELRFWSADTQRMTINSVGNVGIGTTSPDFALDIEAVSSGVQLQIGRTVTSAGSTWMGSDSNGFHLGVGAYGAGNSVSDPNGFSVDTSGNVGIGTTSPTYPLTLSGGAANTNPGTVEAPYIGEELAFKIENPGWSSTNGLIRMIQPAGAYVNNASMTFSTLQGSLTEKMRIENNGNVGIGTTTPSQKLEVTGNFKLNGTLVQEGTGNNLTYKYRTTSSSVYTGGNATCKFGRFYWTPAHWVTGVPVIKVTLHCKYYQGERREYIIKVGYQNTDPIINELQPSSTQQKITLLVGATTSAGYNYAGQPVYYVDLQWVQTAYIWGWAQIESQVGFLTSNPTSTWGGVVMDSGITQTNNSGTPTNYTSFFPGRILLPGLDGKTQVHPDVSYRTSDGELFYQTSSERYKTDIVNLESSLNKVNSLRPVRFTDINTNEPGFGLIAEETVDVIPDVVFSKDEQIEGISYSNLVPFLIKSIQELKAEIEILKNK